MQYNVIRSRGAGDAGAFKVGVAKCDNHLRCMLGLGLLGMMADILCVVREFLVDRQEQLDPNVDPDVFLNHDPLDIVRCHLL